MDYQELYSVDYDSLGNYRQCAPPATQNPLPTPTSTPTPAPVTRPNIRLWLGFAILLVALYLLSRKSGAAGRGGD